MKSGFRALATGCAAFVPLIAAAIALPKGAAADTPIVVGHLERTASPITLKAPVLVDVKEFECGGGAVLPNPTPFPFAIRIGGMISPKSKLAAGVDVIIPLHLVSTLDTRLDGDVIFGANIAGVNTLIPVTIDQLWHKNAAGNSTFYLGGGVGMTFGGITRFGGKLVIGGSWDKLGVEGNVLFAGTGDPLYLVMGRIGL